MSAPTEKKKRFRPVMLLVAIALGVAGYFATTSSWEDLYRIKGAAWFGQEIDAQVLDAGKFTEMSWRSGGGDTKLRDHVRLKYTFEYEGKDYQYPYKDGFVEVSKKDLKKDTIRVTFLRENPERNHPIATDYKYADQMAGVVIGALLLLTTAILLLVFIKSLIFGYTPYQAQPRESSLRSPSTTT